MLPILSMMVLSFHSVLTCSFFICITQRIVGVDRNGDEVHDVLKTTEKELRAAGDLWAEHILENA